MNKKQLEKRGISFIIHKHYVDVTIEERFSTGDGGWDSIDSGWGTYPNLKTAIREVNSDIVFENAKSNLERFMGIAGDAFCKRLDNAVQELDILTTVLPLFNKEARYL